MNIPGFAAESSLGPAMGMYTGKAVHFWTNRGFVARITSISPQQLSVAGTFVNCVGQTEAVALYRAAPLVSTGHLLLGYYAGRDATDELVRVLFGNTDNPTGWPILSRLRRPAVWLRPRAKARSSRFCRLAPSALPASGPCPGRDFWLGRKALNC
jgi:hypothetical protein